MNKLTRFVLLYFEIYLWMVHSCITVNVLSLYVYSAMYILPIRNKAYNRFNLKITQTFAQQQLH